MALPPSRRTRPQPETPLYHSNVPDIEAAAAGGGVSGSGTIGKIPKWTGASALGDSIMTEVGGSVEINPGLLTLKQTDNALEGGQINFDGGGNGGAPFGQWVLDSWSAIMRFFTPSDGLVKWSLDTLGNMQARGKITASIGSSFASMGDVGHGPTWAGFGADGAFNTTDYALLQNNNGLDTRLNAKSGGQVGLYLFNTLQWVLNSGGHFTPGFDVGRDLGSTALRIKDVFVGGAVISNTLNAANAANQATFNTAATNITGLAVTLVPNAIYQVEVVISCTMVLATGVKFFFTAPALTTGEMHLSGNVATAQTWQTGYAASLGISGPFMLTGAQTGQYRINAIVRTGANGGTLQVQGQTGGATTTCAVQKGSYITARRLS